MMTTTTTTTDAQIEDLPWIDHVSESDRPNSTHCITATIGVIRPSEEISELEGRGVTVDAIDGTPQHGTRIYVTL